jgi:hypothetical protein
MRNPNTVISKKTPNGRTLAHLAVTDEKNDRYYYYHATKGWRSRRTMGKDDKQLRKERETQGTLLPTQN